ncbi:MAG: PEGA domain-containing protein [Methanomicrobiales archaeon]|nr:PEGA domain-containing protein [Methanomicrobiales archaeon]
MIKIPRSLVHGGVCRVSERGFQQEWPKKKSISCILIAAIALFILVGTVSAADPYLRLTLNKTQNVKGITFDKVDMIDIFNLSRTSTVLESTSGDWSDLKSIKLPQFRNLRRVFTTTSYEDNGNSLEWIGPADSTLDIFDLQEYNVYTKLNVPSFSTEVPGEVGMIVGEKANLSLARGNMEDPASFSQIAYLYTQGTSPKYDPAIIAIELATNTTTISGIIAFKTEYMSNWSLLYQDLNYNLESYDVSQLNAQGLSPGPSAPIQGLYFLNAFNYKKEFKTITACSLMPVVILEGESHITINGTPAPDVYTYNKESPHDLGVSFTNSGAIKSIGYILIKNDDVEYDVRMDIDLNHLLKNAQDRWDTIITPGTPVITLLIEALKNDVGQGEPFNYNITQVGDSTPPLSVGDIIITPGYGAADHNSSGNVVVVNQTFLNGLLEGEYYLYALGLNSGYDVVAIDQREVKIVGNEWPPVTSLTNTTYLPYSITWNWTDPTGSDFQSVDVYLDDEFKESVAKGEMTYISGNLTPSTYYTLSAQAVYLGGVMSEKVTHTAMTAPIPPVPPASVTNLHNTTYQQTSITWAWSDPSSADFDKVMVFLDGVFKENVTKGTQTYIASALLPSTQHTISTHTVGTTGLVNQTWVTHTAMTAPIPPVSPASVTNLHNTTYQQTSIAWAWADPSSADFDKVMVYLDGVFKENVTKGTQTYIASALLPSTQHTISTHTVGTTGLVNQTWVTHTAMTAPGVFDPVTNLRNTTYLPESINWTWTDPTQSGFTHVSVFLNGVLKGIVLAGVEIYRTPNLTPDTNYALTVQAVYEYGGMSANATYIARTAPEQPVPSPASITNLQTTSIQENTLTWEWNDPVNSGFSKVMVYLDGVFKENVTKGAEAYTASGLACSSTHTISTHTVGTNGRINQTWVNSTATTDTCSPVVTSILPTAANIQTTVDMMVWGENFATEGDVTVHLTRYDQTDIPGTNVIVHDPTYLTCTFDLTNAASGFWFIRVTNPDGKYNTDSPPFTVIGTQAALLLRTVPSGAKISIDGVSYGETDGKYLFGVPEGCHTLTLEKEGYETWTGTFCVKWPVIRNMDGIILKKIGGYGGSNTKTFQKVYLQYSGDSTAPGQTSLQQQQIRDQVIGSASGSGSPQSSAEKTIELFPGMGFLKLR